MLKVKDMLNYHLKNNLQDIYIYIYKECLMEPGTCFIPAFSDKGHIPVPYSDNCYVHRFS